MAKSDLSFRIDRTGKMITNKNLQYYNGIIRMLFFMVPGMDPYNPQKGLNIRKKQFTQTPPGNRDTAYETEISDQFSKYTDLIIDSPIVLYTSSGIKISFKISSDNVVYNTIIGFNEDDLTVLINEGAMNNG